MSRRLALALIVLLPCIAAAQRGGGARSAADRRPERMDKGNEPQGALLRARDIEDQSPLRLLIDKRKDLKLTDAQLAQVKDAEPKLKTENEPLLKAVDSLVRELRPGNSSDDARAHQRDARIGLMATLAEIRTNYDSAAKDVISHLEPDQQSRATELLTKQRDEGEKMIREKVSGGRERPGGTL
jgi:hypothetical protein